VCPHTSGESADSLLARCKAANSSAPRTHDELSRSECPFSPLRPKPQLEPAPLPEPVLPAQRQVSTTTAIVALEQFVSLSPSVPSCTWERTYPRSCASRSAPRVARLSRGMGSPRSCLSAEPSWNRLPGCRRSATASPMRSSPRRNSRSTLRKPAFKRRRRICNGQGRLHTGFPKLHRSNLGFIWAGPHRGGFRLGQTRTDPMEIQVGTIPGLGRPSLPGSHVE
jgi:hypothetical protein